WNITQAACINPPCTSGASHEPMLSPDGQRVVYSSTVTQLVQGDTNVEQDIFLSVLSPVGASLGTVSTERVNLQDQTGAQATGGSSGDPAINDARFPVEDPEILIAFVSSATNLVSPDTNSVQDIFLTGAIPQPTGSHFRRGDANSDASINVSDPIFVL